MDKHTTSNNHYCKVWQTEANENNSRLFVALGVDERGDLQVFPVKDLSILKVPSILREAADRIEQGNTPNNGLIKRI